MKEFLSAKELVTKLMSEGYQQYVIAEHTGVSQPTISRIYKGVAKDPRNSTVEKLRKFAELKNVCQ